MKRLLISLAFLLLAAIPPAATAQQPGLAAAQNFTLTLASDGFEGRLELLQDSRLTRELEEVLWGSGGPDMALDQNDQRLKTFTAVPLHPAVLRLRDAHQQIVAETTFERELVRIRIEGLHPGRRTILATTDLSAGFGSYSGPVTELLEVRGGKLETITARDAQSGAIQPIHLASTLKTAWKLVPAAASNSSTKDILEVACRPNFDLKDTKFFLTYTRYHWDGSGWVAFTRKVHGFWESDNSFPPLERFPKPTGQQHR
jgi:hypothetical protein